MAHRVLNCRTVTNIQNNVVKQGKRGAICRFFHAKDNKRSITAWTLDLDSALCVFNVCSAGFTQSFLSVFVQSEFVDTSHVVVSDVRHDVVNTHMVVSDIRHDVSNTRVITSDVRDCVMNVQTVVSDVDQGVVDAHAIVSELQHNVINTHIDITNIGPTRVKSQKANDDKNRLVSILRTPSLIE